MCKHNYYTLFIYIIYFFFNKSSHLASSIRGCFIVQPTTADKNGKTPLMIAALWCVRTEIIKLLISSGADINAYEFDGWTPLFYAIEQGNLEAVELLLSSGANINVQDDRGRTPLLYAIDEGKLEIVELLIKSGANIEIPSKDRMTPLMLAFWNGHTEILNLLLRDKASIVPQVFVSL